MTNWFHVLGIRFFSLMVIKHNMPAGGWIAHVKATWKKNGGSYKDAMKAAKKTWSSKKKGSSAEPAAAPKRKRGRKKKKVL